MGSLVIVDAGLAVSFTRQPSKVRLSLFNSDLLIERDSRAIARHEGGVFTIGNPVCPFSLENFPQGSISWRNFFLLPLTLYQRSRLATSGSRRAELLRAAHAAVSTVRTRNRGACLVHYRLTPSANYILPTKKQKKKQDARAIVDVLIIHRPQK